MWLINQNQIDSYQEEDLGLIDRNCNDLSFSYYLIMMFYSTQIKFTSITFESNI